MPKLPILQKLLKSNGTKILIYPAVKTRGDDYDPYSKNYDYSNLNPHTVFGYVTTISPEALVWKQYGLEELGSIEVICEAKYKELFKLARKVTVNGTDYSVFKSGNNRVLIMDRPFSTIRVVLQKLG